MSTTWIFWCRHYKTQSFEQITFTLVCIISLLTFCAWWKSQSLFPDHDKKFAWRSSSVGRAAFQRSQSGATLSTDVSSNPVRDHLLLPCGMGVWNNPSRSIWLQLRLEFAQFRKAEGKNPAWQKMASVLSDHIFTKTVDFQIFRSFLESLFEPLIETFSSYNKKLSWPNPLSCSVMRPKKGSE